MLDAVGVPRYVFTLLAPSFFMVLVFALWHDWAMRKETKDRMKTFFKRWSQCYSWPTKSDLAWAARLPFNFGVFRLAAFRKSRPVGISGWLNRFRDIAIVMVGLALLDSAFVAIGLFAPIGR